MVNVFAGLGKARPSASGVYVQPGEHDFEITLLKLVTSTKPGKVGLSTFIAELRTEKSTCHPVGSTISYTINMANGEMALGDLKAFLCTLTGARPEEVDEDIASAAVSDEQPFRGYRVHCSAHAHTTKNGKAFTKTAWTLTAAA